MARQFSGKEHHRYKFCERCLHGFQNTISLEKHLELCGEHKAFSFTMPTEDSKFEFTNWYKTFSVPLAIYADTEAVSLKHDTCRQNPDTGYTLNKETQKPRFFVLLIKKVEVIIIALKVRNASKSFFGGSERTLNLFLRENKSIDVSEYLMKNG